jgi:YbbR domain-containing protein
MRTDASREQATQPIPEAALDDPATSNPVAHESLLPASGPTTDLPESALLTPLGPTIAAPAPRPSARRTTRVRWLVNVVQSLSLDDRLGRIILSIILAALLWFYVASLENPAQVTQFNRLTPALRGLPSNLKVINTIPTVDVTVQAPQSIMNSLRESDVRPYIDLAPLGAGVHEVPVSVDVNGLADRNAINLSVAPRSVQVQLEVQATRSYSVSTQTIGTPAIGYSLEAGQVQPDKVSVTGSENDINRIAQVVVSVDVEQKAATQRGFKNPVALDSSGQEISGLTFQPTTVQVVVPIKLLFNYKLVPVHVPVVDNPAPGYSAYEIKLDPSNVTICCAAGNILEPISSLETEPVSISGTTATVVTTTNLVLPAGVELYPGQSRVISVTVRIDTFETSWQLSVAPSVEGLTPGTAFVLSPNSLDITLSGTLAQFQNLKPADVRASVDVTGLGPGTYELDPQVTVPSGVKLSSFSPAKVTVSLIPPTPVPPTPTQVPVAPTPTLNSITAPSQTSTATPTHTSLPRPTETSTQSAPLTPTHTLTPSPVPTATLTPGIGPEQAGTPPPQATP